MKGRVYISTTSFAGYDRRPLRLLEENGITYELNPYGRKMEEKEIGSVLENGGFQGLIAGTEPLTGTVLNRAKELTVISRVGVGMDNIDQDAARERGISLCNTPDILTDAVAELTVGMMLCCLRMIPLMDQALRQGQWKKEMGCLLKDKLVGIIGLGSIGRRVAELAGCFGARIIFCDIRDVAVTGPEKVFFERLISESDIITIHSSGKGKILGKAELAGMKKGAVIVNTSRGEAVDEDALYEALQSQHLFGAALDVYGREPYKGKLQQCGRCVLTPHAGSYAREARIAMELKAVENLICCLKQRKDANG